MVPRKYLQNSSSSSWVTASHFQGMPMVFIVYLPGTYEVLTGGLSDYLHLLGTCRYLGSALALH